ncbi:unnamed protein product [Onchocerca flexuosa]|uniref:7TM_GPCR_Srx domain-containing protein n=1 Tax=Onchocerca flexuosa TaxID=387005 RepID=A0A183I8P1_9BILA|nr:unnamed protein product [Onchocerca flexuosa]
MTKYKSIQAMLRKESNRLLAPESARSCISGLTMIILALVFNIGQRVLTNKWALFAVSTISWEMAHVLDG